MNGWDNMLVGSVVLGAISLGLGLMIVTAQDRTRTTLGIAGVYLFVGSSIPLGFHLAGTVEPGPAALARTQGLLEAAALVMASVYLGGLAATSRASSATLRTLTRVVLTGFLLAGVIAVLGLAFPAERLNLFQFRALDPDSYNHPGFWLFAVPWTLVMTVFSYAYYLLVRECLDVGERARALCTLLASPLLIGTLALPRPVALVSGVLSLVITLYGQYRFAVAQGERAAFLSRFLSPQVVEQVRQDGLTSVMRAGEAEVTVVACDLRGFTSYAEGVPSQAVIDLLSEYYEAVGRVVAEVDGTIKDYAGDGILILLGAPLTRPDHAAAGLRLAGRIHQVTGPVIARWATGPHPLGIGVGAATGRVTVGAIGSDSRMEYTAVGVPVNLASRLCGSAAAGETLVDEQLAAAAGVDGLVSRDPVTLKGFGGQVAVFATASNPTGG